MYPLCRTLRRKSSITSISIQYITLQIIKRSLQWANQLPRKHYNIFFFFISDRFKVSVSRLCIPWGTGYCCDEISINSAQFSIELTRQLISISVSVTSSALDLFSCDLASSQLGVMCVCVCVCPHTLVWFCESSVVWALQLWEIWV